MSGKAIKVLLIEDNLRDARILCDMLSQEFEVEHADCLLEGLKYLAKGGIDVILLDLFLPESKGLPTFVKVQSKAPKLPIVILSGLDDEAIAIEAVQKGAQEYLVKRHLNIHLLPRSLNYAIDHKWMEEKLKEKVAELEKFTEIAVVRELKMAEMEKEIESLKGEN
ncbi:response regulator [bacterium]|nr:response regulator [bacterium]MBU1615511.1 response regulator [bacterium]